MTRSLPARNISSSFLFCSFLFYFKCYFHLSPFPLSLSFFQSSARCETVFPALLLPVSLKWPLKQPFLLDVWLKIIINNFYSFFLFHFLTFLAFFFLVKLKMRFNRHFQRKQKLMKIDFSFFFSFSSCRYLLFLFFFFSFWKS